MPNRLGAFDIARRLATGGMATLYLGFRQGGPRQPMALKVIRDEFAKDPSYVDMFMDESKILGLLHHPNIVRTYETGVSEGHLYIAMELLLGVTVAELCDECGRRGTHIPPVLAAELCAQVARALHYAHELKDTDGTPLHVIHRDANPSNILLTFTGETKLIDFGLAKAQKRVTKSVEGIVKGKVPYLSPEQISQRELDQRSDLYTLGATLWEMTTGRRLWKRESDIQTIMAIKQGDVPDPTEIVEGYPEELWAIAWEALLKNRDDRYANAAKMADDLTQFVRRTGISGDTAGRLRAYVSAMFPGLQARREREVAEALGSLPETGLP